MPKAKNGKSAFCRRQAPTPSGHRRAPAQPDDVRIVSRGVIMRVKGIRQNDLAAGLSISEMDNIKNRWTES
jgi:hypothetical protein